jgi:hypothetical protein
VITLIISTTKDIPIPEKINKKFNFKIGAAFGRIRQHQIAKARKAVSATYTGGCQCRQIRYEIRAEPLTLYLCHCQECQKQSSSAFGMSLTVPRDAVVIIQGQPKAWTRKADSGREVTCLFCGDCGTRLFHERTYSETSAAGGFPSAGNWRTRRAKKPSTSKPER